MVKKIITPANMMNDDVKHEFSTLKKSKKTKLGGSEINSFFF